MVSHIVDNKPHNALRWTISSMWNKSHVRDSCSSNGYCNLRPSLQSQLIQSAFPNSQNQERSCSYKRGKIKTRIIQLSFMVMIPSEPQEAITGGIWRHLSELYFSAIYHDCKVNLSDSTRSQTCFPPVELLGLCFRVFLLEIQI